MRCQSLFFLFERNTQIVHRFGWVGKRLYVQLIIISRRPSARPEQLERRALDPNHDRLLVLRRKDVPTQAGLQPADLGLHIPLLANIDPPLPLRVDVAVQGHADHGHDRGVLLGVRDSLLPWRCVLAFWR